MHLTVFQPNAVNIVGRRMWIKIGADHDSKYGTEEAKILYM